MGVCCSRFKTLLRCYHTTSVISNAEQCEVSIHIVPESFRIWFILSFEIFSIIGIFVSVTWANLDYEHNPVVENFGASNLCLFFDEPPFSYFGAALYVPVIILIVIYLVLDNIRVYFNYKDKRDKRYEKITKGFYIIYSIFTIWHLFAFIYFIQIFATGPLENLPVHYMGYMGLQYGFWTLALIHFIYFKKIKIIKEDSFLGILGIFYVVLMVVICVIKTAINVPNAYGAKLFMKYPWTMTVSDIETPIFHFLVMIAPIIIYLIYIDDLDQLHLVLRTKPGFKYAANVPMTSSAEDTEAQAFVQQNINISK